MQTLLQTKLAEAQSFIPHNNLYQNTPAEGSPQGFQQHFLSALNKAGPLATSSEGRENSAHNSVLKDFLTQKYLDQHSGSPDPSETDKEASSEKSSRGGSLEDIVLSLGTEHHELISGISAASSLDERLRLAEEFRSHVAEALETGGHKVSVHADSDKLVVNGRVIDILNSLYSSGRPTAVQVLDLGAHDGASAVAAESGERVRDPGTSANLETRVKAVLDEVSGSSAGREAIAAVSAATGIASRKPHANEFSRLVIAKINALEGLSARDGNGKDKIYIQDQSGNEYYYDLIRNADGPGTASPHLLRLS